MNIGNITSNNFNLDNNGKNMQIEVYEQLIEQLQQENEKLRKNIYNAKEYIEQHRIREMNMVEVNALEGILNE